MLHPKEEDALPALRRLPRSPRSWEVNRWRSPVVRDGTSVARLRRRGAGEDTGLHHESI